MIDYFFSGNRYIRVSRGDTGPGSVNSGYPAPISNWGWGSFGANGIDAALYSGSKCYFFSGNEYIRVTRGVTGPGTVDAGYPAPISNWGWGAFGANGIDAALWSGSVCYFFKGTGKLLGNVTINILGQTLRTTGKPATSANLAPLAAFQFNIGGDAGSTTAKFTGGAGTITYSASNALTATSTEPSYTDFNDGTAENGNLVFGPLPQTANQVITQSFQATTGGSEPESREVTAGQPAPRTRALPPREPAPAPRTRALPARA
jgi:hypothetical protein